MLPHIFEQIDDSGSTGAAQTNSCTAPRGRHVANGGVKGVERAIWDVLDACLEREEVILIEFEQGFGELGKPVDFLNDVGVDGGMDGHVSSP